MTKLEKAIKRITRGALDYSYGPDRNRPLVAALELGDLLTLRPLGTRRVETLDLFDLYRYALVRRVNCERLTKARAKKEAMAERRRALAWKRELRKAKTEGE